MLCLSLPLFHNFTIFRAKVKYFSLSLLLLQVEESCSVRKIMDGGGAYNPRTVEEVFRDFKGRRSGMIKALTTGKSNWFQSNTSSSSSSICHKKKKNSTLRFYPFRRCSGVLPTLWSRWVMSLTKVTLFIVFFQLSSLVSLFSSWVLRWYINSFLLCFCESVLSKVLIFIWLFLNKKMFILVWIFLRIHDWL